MSASPAVGSDAEVLGSKTNKKQSGAPELTWICVTGHEALRSDAVKGFGRVYVYVRVPEPFASTFAMALVSISLRKFV
jgi:hypothetical protein